MISNFFAVYSILYSLFIVVLYCFEFVLPSFLHRLLNQKESSSLHQPFLDSSSLDQELDTLHLDESHPQVDILDLKDQLDVLQKQLSLLMKNQSKST